MIDKLLLHSRFIGFEVVPVQCSSPVSAIELFTKLVQCLDPFTEKYKCPQVHTYMTHDVRHKQHAWFIRDPGLMHTPGQRSATTLSQGPDCTGSGIGATHRHHHNYSALHCRANVGLAVSHKTLFIDSELHIIFTSLNIRLFIFSAISKIKSYHSSVVCTKTGDRPQL